MMETAIKHLFNNRKDKALIDCKKEEVTTYYDKYIKYKNLNDISKRAEALRDLLMFTYHIVGFELMMATINKEMECSEINKSLIAAAIMNQSKKEYEVFSDLD